MDVYFDCYHCKAEGQLAKDVTEEIPTPVGVTGKCAECGKTTHIMDQAREKWLEDRGLEIKNTSHPKWHVKDVQSVDDLQFEFSLYLHGHHRLMGYQVGYHSMALLFFQKWADENGFNRVPPKRYILRLAATYNHKDGNSHHIATDNVIGFYGSDEAVERAMKARMSWGGCEWMTKEHFDVQKIDTGYGQP